MGKQFGYKKYMKKNVRKEDHHLIKLFVVTLFGMLLIFTYLIKSFSPSVDVSIGDYQDETVDSVEEPKNPVDNRLTMIQNEDQGRNFSDLMAKPDDVVQRDVHKEIETSQPQAAAEEPAVNTEPAPVEQQPQQEVVYKVFVGTYTSAEQAKVAKDIIQESGSGLNPIVKCIGSNNYTLQVGIFKNKSSAETMLYTVQQNHLPGRIVQDY